MRKRLIRFLSSAGGGKTYQLSRRYIELLKKKHENPKTLAITFTNKAASEMKERILQLLKEEAIEKGDKDSIKLVDWILDNYSDFSVRTIDSFVNTLVKGFSIELGFPTETELIMESDYYKDYAVSLLIQSAEEDEGFRKRLTDFILNKIEFERKTNWDFPGIIRRGMNKIEDYEKKQNKNFKFPGGKAEEIDEEIKRKLKKSFQLAEEILEYSATHEGIHKNLLTAIEKSLQSKNIDKMLKSAYFEKDCRGVLKNIEKFDPTHFCSLFEALKKSVFEYYSLYLFRDHDYNINIYGLYENFLKKIKQEERVRFIEDINGELKSLFDEFEIPFIFYRYGERYEHYLIDEFQDTSRSQWINLKPLVENSLSEGGSFFYVGDPKQAIYQWRGGDVELFDRAFTNFPSVEESDRGTNLTFINYRSAPEIVNFVGEVFSQLPPEVKEKMGKKGSFYGVNVIQKIDPDKKWGDFTGYVSLERFSSKDNLKENIDEAIKGKLKKNIKEVLKRFSPGDITVLVRKNADGKKVVDWLTEEGYQVISNESLYLSSDPNIKGLLSFFNFLQHPVDNVSFLGFITCPFFLKDRVSEKEIIRWAEEIYANRPLYIKFREDFPKVWEVFIQPFFRRVGFLPLYDLLSDIIRTFRIPENFKETQPFLLGFLEFIHNLEEKSITSIGDMMKEWERRENSKNPPSILLPENTDAIKVMTIHRAKGLEFPVVILPFLYFWEGKDKNEVVIQYNGIERIVKVKTKNKGKFILPETNPALKKEISSRIKEKRASTFFEEVNNLYVALTRAKYELYIFIPEEGSPQSYSKLWKDILDRYVRSGDYSRGKRTTPEKKESKENYKQTYLEMKIDDKEGIERASSRLLLKTTNINEITNKKSIEARKTGEILHRILYYIKDIKDLENLESIVQRSLNEFALPTEREIFKKKAFSTIQRIFKNKEIRKWFAPGLSVWREKEMIDSEGNLYRFDRVILQENEIALIDYKTGEEPSSKWKKQLLNYKELLEQYFPEKEINSYIINLSNNLVLKIE
ncbi:MAG: UvrD-helicase domain-containing protein [candidate division WOR-3 bacterium]|nr:UvrD-helicase domain-containing protein [candidate division WOR-3 bacterium]